MTTQTLSGSSLNSSGIVAQKGIEVKLTQDDSQSQLNPNEIPEQNPVIDSFELEGSENDEDAEYPTGLKFVFILMATGLSLVLVGLDFSIIATAVPAITTHFKTIADVGWYYSA